MTAILRYNNSVAYARNVLGWAASYATGVAPVNLPPITGPTPPIADARLDAHLAANPEGLGPGLVAADPLPLFSLTQSDVANQLPVPPGPADASTQTTPLNAPCTIFCISDSTPAQPAAVPPWRAAGRAAAVGAARSAALDSAVGNACTRTRTGSRPRVGHRACSRTCARRRNAATAARRTTACTPGTTGLVARTRTCSWASAFRARGHRAGRAAAGSGRLSHFRRAQGRAAPVVAPTAPIRLGNDV